MLKKFFTVIAICILSVAFVGCSSASVKEEVATFVSEPQKGITSELTYYYSDDIVSKQTLKNTLDFTKLDVDKEAVTAQIKELSKQYVNVKGIQHDIKINENEIVETATIDYTNLDFEKAKKIPGIVIGNGANKISFKASKQSLESQGYTLKK